MSRSAARPQLPGADYKAETWLMIEETVTDYRNHGHTREVAMKLACVQLDMGLRRLRAVLHSEIWISIGVAEYRSKRQRFLDHLANESMLATARAESINTRLGCSVGGGICSSVLWLTSCFNFGS